MSDRITLKTVKLEYIVRITISLTVFSLLNFVFAGSTFKGKSRIEKTISVLTLNLHTYQEEDQERKFDEIAEFIFKHKVDIVCFQECAQHIESPFVSGSSRIRIDNAAPVIVEKLSRLGEEYFYAWDWAHYGFKEWEEGVAILSRYPLKNVEARYVSSIQSLYAPLHSRKVIYAKISLSDKNALHVFSAHLSSEPEGLMEQVENLLLFVQEKMNSRTMFPAIISGDFNDEPTGRGYREIINSGCRDSFLNINPGAADQKTARENLEDRHIDYIFYISPHGKLTPIKSRMVFTGVVSGAPVSDHYGVYTVFRIEDIMNLPD